MSEATDAAAQGSTGQSNVQKTAKTIQRNAPTSAPAANTTPAPVPNQNMGASRPRRVTPQQ